MVLLYIIIWKARVFNIINLKFATTVTSNQIQTCFGVVVIVLGIALVSDRRDDGGLHLLVVDLLPVHRLEPSMSFHVI